jgi:hypothetical protein
VERPGKSSFDILHAAGGLGGTTFTSASSSNPNFSAKLSYTATDVFLNVTGTLAAATTLTQNQQNVANTINNAFNAGGTLPGNLAGVRIDRRQSCQCAVAAQR